MKETASTDYRSRIYAAYVTARSQALVPSEIAGLWPRVPSKASRFSGIRCFEDRPVPHGLKSIVRATSWAVVRAALLLYVAVETDEQDLTAAFSQNLLAVATRGS